MSHCGKQEYFDEVDLLLKEEGEISAFEIKSSQTYSPSFENSLKKLSGWIHTPIRRKSVVYAGRIPLRIIVKPIACNCCRGPLGAYIIQHIADVLQFKTHELYLFDRDSLEPFDHLLHLTVDLGFLYCV